MKITFSTYPALYRAFKGICELSGKKMGEQLAEITELFLCKKLTLCALEEQLGNFRRENVKEKKEYKLTVMMNPELYSELKDALKETRVRPASFMCASMAYAITSVPVRKVYAEKAQRILDESAPEIAHVVYGLKYYRPITKEKMIGTILVGTEYFIDCCTETRFQEWYGAHSPLLEVLALHK